jgi:hypothetical protein
MAYWGWLEEGSFRWSAQPLIEDGRHLGFGFRRLSDKRLGWLVRIFVAYRGWLAKVPFDDKCHRSFNMAATAPIMDLISIHYLTNASVDWSDFFGSLLGGNCRKVPFNDKCHHSFKMPLQPSLIWLPSNASTPCKDTWYTAPPNFAISPNFHCYNMPVRDICHARHCSCYISCQISWFSVWHKTTVLDTSMAQITFSPLRAAAGFIRWNEANSLQGVIYFLGSIKHQFRN